MNYLTIVLNDIENMRVKQNKIKMEFLKNSILNEIKILSEQYSSCIELCIDDETQIQNAVSLKEQIQAKIQELSAFIEVPNV